MLALAVFPIFSDPVAVEVILTEFMHHITTHHAKVDVIVALDARGFLFGPTIAQRLQCRFVPVRKGGKVSCRAPSLLLMLWGLVYLPPERCCC